MAHRAWAARSSSGKAPAWAAPSSDFGFQTSADCQNFIETVERSLDIHIDRGRHVIAYGDRRVMVRAYPVSVEWPNRWVRQSPPVATCRLDVRRRLRLPADLLLTVGVDRLDYPKGITKRITSLSRRAAHETSSCSVTAPESAAVLQYG